MHYSSHLNIGFFHCPKLELSSESFFFFWMNKKVKKIGALPEHSQTPHQKKKKIVWDFWYEWQNCIYCQNFVYYLNFERTHRVRSGFQKVLITNIELYDSKMCEAKQSGILLYFFKICEAKQLGILLYFKLSTSAQLMMNFDLWH